MKIGQLTLHMKTWVYFIIFRHVRDSYKTNGRVRGAEETFELFKYKLTLRGCHMWESCGECKQIIMRCVDTIYFGVAW